MSAGPTTAGLLRAAGIALGVAAALVGLIAVLGGFRPAPDVARARAAGEDVDLARWTIVVDQAEFTDRGLDGSAGDPVVRLSVRISNTTLETVDYLPERLITVRVGDTELADVTLPYGQPGGTGSYDPDIAAERILDYAWSEVPTPPAEITVVLRDEQERPNFVTGETWTVGGARALVRVPCPDRRSKR